MSMRCLVAILALAMFGCGHKDAAPASAPAPAPFHDIAGAYTGTAEGAPSGYYHNVTVGTTITFTISGDGVATTSDGTVYHITRQPDGSFISDQVVIVPAGVGSYAIIAQVFAPADLSLMEVMTSSPGSTTTVEDGYVLYSLVKTTSG